MMLQAFLLANSGQDGPARLPDRRDHPRRGQSTSGPTLLDAKALPILEGISEIQRRIIAAEL